VTGISDSNPMSLLFSSSVATASPPVELREPALRPTQIVARAHAPGRAVPGPAQYELRLMPGIARSD